MICRFKQVILKSEVCFPINYKRSKLSTSRFTLEAGVMNI